MDDRQRQTRWAHYQAFVTTMALLEADDIDLWLQAHDLSVRAVDAVRQRRARDSD